eukprot:UN07001
MKKNLCIIIILQSEMILITIFMQILSVTGKLSNDIVLTLDDPHAAEIITEKLYTDSIFALQVAEELNGNIIKQMLVKSAFVLKEDTSRRSYGTFCPTSSRNSMSRTEFLKK